MMFDWDPVSAAGALPVLDLREGAGGRAGSWICSNHTISMSVGTGTLTVCSFQLEGSDDGVNWYSMSGPQSSTVAMMLSVENRPARMIRINVLTYEGTAPVTFYWTGGV